MKALDWIAKWADYTPEQIAIISYDTLERYSYKDLHTYSLRLVEKLEALDLQQSDRIAVIAEHSLFYIVLMSACQRLGLILVPLNYKVSPVELESLLEDCSPSLIIYDKQIIELEQLNITKIPHISTTQIEYTYKQNFQPESRNFDIDGEATLFIFYTSGTTGFPKGVMYTNKMMFWNSLNTSALLGIDYNDSTLISLPPYHTSGWHVFLTPLLHKGATIGILKKFDPEKVLCLIELNQITLYMVLPTMLQMMQATSVFDDVSLSSLRFIISGGEALSSALVNRFIENGTPIRQGYGLTEAGPGITSLHHDMVLKKPNSIGKPNFYLDIKILTTEGKVARPFEVGELLLKGDVITPGYWNNSIETNKKIKNKWLHTGDLVYADSEGYLFLKGRKDDMYISGGENIYPIEIEQILLKHADVVNAVVLSVPDQTWGQVGLVFVTVANDLDVNTIRRYLAKSLVKFKHPKHIFILSEIPISSVGKVCRQELMNFYNSLKIDS